MVRQGIWYICILYCTVGWVDFLNQDFLTGVLLKSEASLIVPDFTIYVYGSSCNYLFALLILSPFLSLSIYIGLPKAGRDAKKYIERESKGLRMRLKK